MVDQKEKDKESFLPTMVILSNSLKIKQPTKNNHGFDTDVLYSEGASETSLFLFKELVSELVEVEVEEVNVEEEIGSELILN